MQDLQTLFDVPAEFDINDYAVRLLPPWLKTPVPQEFSEPQEAGNPNRNIGKPTPNQRLWCGRMSSASQLYLVICN
ncbi:MAG: hypothetical protein NHB32_10895 [Fischerella sp. CENA71]|nr:hypothetical protein [Fischerella sp. CENA71]